MSLQNFALSIFVEVCGLTDELFDLKAPAAMGRGPWSGYAHGEQINGIWDDRLFILYCVVTLSCRPHQHRSLAL